MSEEALKLLRSIDASLKQILARQGRGSQTAAAGLPVASDRDLDGKYGDPVLKYNPQDWTGASFKERNYSECPPELLDIIANNCEYFAKKAEENNERTKKGNKPRATFIRGDAALARGWARRIRARGGPPAPTNGNGTPPSEFNDQDGSTAAWMTQEGF